MNCTQPQSAARALARLQRHWLNTYAPWHFSVTDAGYISAVGPALARVDSAPGEGTPADACFRRLETAPPTSQTGCGPITAPEPSEHAHHLVEGEWGATRLRLRGAFHRLDTLPISHFIGAPARGPYPHDPRSLHLANDAPLAHGTPRRLNILLATDDPMNALVATRHLARVGHDVARVRDAVEAAAIALARAFDVVLLGVPAVRADVAAAFLTIRDAVSRAGTPTPLIAMTPDVPPCELAVPGSSHLDAILLTPLNLAHLDGYLAPFVLPV